jgi:hypothetical protein
MRWYGLRLVSDHAAAGGPIWKLLWEASVAGEPVDDGNAVFLAQEGDGCVTLYFSPSARLLATAIGASRCRQPDPQGLTLLAGPQRAWDVHFRAGDCTPATLRVQAAG